jgi:uncharacterized protein (TIGR02271 family)
VEKRTITAMFDDYQSAANAVTRLKAVGIPEGDISLVGGNESMRTASAPGAIRNTTDTTADEAGTGAAIGAAVGGGAGLLVGLGLLAIPGFGPVVAAGWLASTLLGAGAGAATGGMIGALTGAGIPEDDAHAYAEGIRRGGTLVTVRTEMRLVDKVVDILDDDGTVDMENRVKTWQKEGWTGRYAGAGASSVRPEQSGSIPVVEEELKVGKRQVAAGRVRIHSHVVEQPVQEQISLTNERVRVERRPVDRPATSADRLMQDRTIEATERREEAVVSKEARVKEEVRLSKDVDRRTETVSDTVRKTKVEVDDSRGQTPRTGNR